MSVATRTTHCHSAAVETAYVQRPARSELRRSFSSLLSSSASIAGACRQQAIEERSNHQGLDSPSNTLSSSSLFAPSSVSATSAVSAAIVNFRASPPIAGVKSTTNVPHDSWPITASQSVPSFAKNRRIVARSTRTSEVESQSRAERKIVRSLSLHIEPRRALEIELADVVLGHQAKAQRLSESDISSETDVRREVRGARLQDGRVDVVVHRARTDLSKRLKADSARRGKGQVELKSAIVEKRRAVRDRIAAEKGHAGCDVRARVAEVSDQRHVRIDLHSQLHAVDRPGSVRYARTERSLEVVAEDHVADVGRELEGSAAGDRCRRLREGG